MNSVYNSIMEGLANAIEDVQSKEKKLKRREVSLGESASKQTQEKEDA